MRRLLLCLPAAAALGLAAIVPAGALGASTAPTTAGASAAKGGTSAASGGTGTSAGSANLLESGGTGSSAAGGAEEEGGEEGAEAAKKKTASGATSSSEESSGFGSLPIIFGMGGAAVLIAAIALFILRDARRNAPVTEGALNASTRMSAEQIRKRRSKAKAVKQQRKRNRTR